MALQVWLPLINDLHNQGLASATVSGGSKQTSGGKLGAGHYKVYSGAGLTIAHTIADTTEFTFAYWLNIPSSITSVGAWNTFMSIPAKHNDTSAAMCVSWASYNQMKWYDSTGYDQKLWQSFSYDTWYHIAVVHSSGTLKIYINGELGSRDYTMSQTIKLTAGTITIGGGMNATNAKLGLQDFRLYNKALSAEEIKHISQGLVAHYTLGSACVCEATTNLGNTSATYSNQNHGVSKSSGGWSGNTGTVTFYKDSGVGNAPYKKLHRNTKGSGGIYSKTADDITIESGKTYTMSCWIKASENVTLSNYGFCINRGSDNHYITYGSDFSVTTSWKRFEKTFTTSSSEGGSYGEMSIVYNQGASDTIDVYYSGFQIEQKDHATFYTLTSRAGLVYDSSGYSRNLTITGNVSPANSVRYDKSLYLPNQNINSNYLTSGSAWSPTFMTAGSISFWCKFNGLGSSGWLPFVGQDGSHYVMAWNNGGNFYHQNAGTPTAIYRDGVSVSAPSDNGNWHHYVITGINISSWTIFRVNQYGNGWDSNMYISDLRLYNTVLSADDVKELYNLGASIS